MAKRSRPVAETRPPIISDLRTPKKSMRPPQSKPYTEVRTSRGVSSKMFFGVVFRVEDMRGDLSRCMFN